MEGAEKENIVEKTKKKQGTLGKLSAAWRHFPTLTRSEQ